MRVFPTTDRKLVADSVCGESDSHRPLLSTVASRTDTRQDRRHTQNAQPLLGTVSQRLGPSGLAVELARAHKEPYLMRAEQNGCELVPIGSSEPESLPDRCGQGRATYCSLKPLDRGQATISDKMLLRGDLDAVLALPASAQRPGDQRRKVIGKHRAVRLVVNDASDTRHWRIGCHVSELFQYSQ